MVDRAFGVELPVEQHAAAPLSGGIAGNGYQCGMVWGSALAAGAEAHRRFGAGPRAEALAVVAAQRIVTSFRAQNGAIDCFDLTGIDFESRAQTWRYLLTGKAVSCFRMAARYAPVAKAEIETALALPFEPPETPVSCAAVTARRLGADERHAVMVAGFAGGIGLCGGACGALGAAVWVNKMAGALGLEAVEARVAPTIARFVAATGGRFGCEEIVGRRFEDVSDHARFVRGGGCAKVIGAFAGREPPRRWESGQTIVEARLPMSSP